LLREQCEGGAAGVLVTHESRHAAWADRIVFLRDGRIVDETGSTVPRDDSAPPRRNGDAIPTGGRS
jgi:putative ABC transport system ATP-binding protein